MRTQDADWSEVVEEDGKLARVNSLAPLFQCSGMQSEVIGHASAANETGKGVRADSAPSRRSELAFATGKKIGFCMLSAWVSVHMLINFLI